MAICITSAFAAKSRGCVSSYARIEAKSTRSLPHWFDVMFKEVEYKKILLSGFDSESFSTSQSSLKVSI
jgi:hypothetical protein